MLGHTNITGVYPELLNSIQSFCVPIFFVVSGVLIGIKEAKGTEIRYEVWKKAKAYLTPYFVFSVIYIIIVDGMTYIGNHEAGLSAVHDSVYRLALGDGCFATWFLPAFFGAELIAIFEKRNLRCSVTALINIVLAVVTMLWCPDFLLFRVVLRILVGSIFIFAGRMLVVLYRNYKKSGTLLVLFFVVAYCTLLPNNGLLDLANLKFGNYRAFYYLESIAGSVIVIFLFFKLVNRNVPMLTWIGKNTLIILVTHRIYYELLWVFESRVPLGNVYIEPFVMFAITVGLEFFTISFCNKYLYMLFGKTPGRIKD